jgi:hypothetical protein
MKPVEGEEAQAVWDAVAVGDPIPYGYAYNGTTVYLLEEEDHERIDAGGNVEPPDTTEEPIVEGAPSETPKGSPSNPVVGDPV